MSITINGTTGISGVDGSSTTPAFQGNDTNTGIFFSAADTIDFAEGGTTVGQFDSSANFKFNSGYGSVETAFGCRAWVNFNGLDTVAIRGSGNVSSITDNGVGDYTINFTTAMPDANYATTAMTSSWDSTQSANTVVGFRTTNSVDPTTYTSSAVRISLKRTQSTTFDDRPYISFSIFR